MPLYLLPSGRFALFGVWHGFEYSCAAGAWDGTADAIHVIGRGSINSDSGNTVGRYERTFRAIEKGGIRQLRGDSVPGWSLLSWDGPYEFQGDETYVDLRGRIGPTDWDGLEDWISDYLANTIKP